MTYSVSSKPGLGWHAGEHALLESALNHRCRFGTPNTTLNGGIVSA
jgi:hypothetical protein